MKNGFLKIAYALILAGSELMSGDALAGDNPADSGGMLAQNPYTPIIVRNAFALNALPDPKVEKPDADTSPALPKITVQGFMNLLEKPGVLFKVLIPAQAGQPAVELPCVLREGEEQGEIKLIRIDQTAGTVIFNNHGIVQEIQLAGW